MYFQSAIHPPRAASGSDSDIIHAGKSRRDFWCYPPGSTWTVPVIVGKREVFVKHDATSGQCGIKR